jgi:hypothetical protein
MRIVHFDAKPHRRDVNGTTITAVGLKYRWMEHYVEDTSS